MLVDVQGGQPKGYVRLQLWGEALLRHVVAALHEQVVESVQVCLCDGRRRRWHKGNAEEAAQLVGARSRGDLRGEAGERESQ